MKPMTIALATFVTLQAWAHGENELGPHGGFISMPGAFHVELVPVSSRRLKAYLLDMEWKNPSLKDSSISLSRESARAECRAKADHFVCEFPDSVDLGAKGELKVIATREKSTGVPVKYELPLKLKKEH